MRWDRKTRRIVKRFAWLPKEIKYPNDNEPHYVWLETYYVRQTHRSYGFGWWDDYEVDRETWEKRRCNNG